MNDKKKHAAERSRPSGIFYYPPDLLADFSPSRIDEIVDQILANDELWNLFIKFFETQKDSGWHAAYRDFLKTIAPEMDGFHVASLQMSLFDCFKRQREKNLKRLSSEALARLYRKDP